MQSFTDTAIWQKGLQTTKGIFIALDRCRIWSLADQLRRASTSILANYAEGYGRSSCADKAHKYVIARGECTEVEALLIIAKEVGALTPEKADLLQCGTKEIGRMLNGLIRKYSKESHS